MSDDNIQSPSQIQRLVEDDFAPTIRQRIAEAIVTSFEIAENRCADLRIPTKRDTIAHLRRGIMETQFGQVMTDLGYEIEDVANSIRSSNHVRATVGQCVITQHAVNDASELPRDADHRFTIARSSQTELFDKPQPPPPDAKAYCQLLYGPRKGQSPTFAIIVAPTADCSSIVARLDLTPEVVAAKLAGKLRGTERQIAQEEFVLDEVKLAIRGGVAVDESGFDAVALAETERVSDHVQLTLADWTTRKAQNEGGGG